MGKKLLHTIGRDKEGHILHISKAEKGETYTCPLCGDRLITRNKSQAQRPHFAHFKKTKANCNGETLLFYLFRQKAVSILKECIERKEAFPIRWTCPLCNRLYEKDMLQQVSSITTDMDIEGYHPDITLTDSKGHPIIAITLLFRKKLSKKTLHFYEEKGIILIQIRLKEDDWMYAKEKLSNPDVVTLCENAECYNFQFYNNCIRREYYAQKFKCKKCGKVVDGYMVRNTSSFGIIGLDRLNDYEKQEIVSKFFRGKRATVADILVYGKCRCVPHSKGLVCLNKSDDFKQARQGKITKGKK